VVFRGHDREKDVQRAGAMSKSESGAYSTWLKRTRLPTFNKWIQKKPAWACRDSGPRVADAKLEMCARTIAGNTRGG